MRIGIVLFCLASLTAAATPRYVFINKAPGIEWSAGHPDTFTEGFREVVDTIAAPENPALRIGVTFVFDFLRYDLETVKQSLGRFLALSEETGVPVLVQLDGQNWWGPRPDLWNWWDPDQPGYDPANARNVEWTDWGPEHAVKICWRNWGSQIRVLPAPNLGSPDVLEAHREALDALVPVVAQWFEALPQDRKYLFGGLKVGHEASIGYNAYHYPDGNRLLGVDPSNDPKQGLRLAEGFHGGVAPLGYAALATLGIRNSGTIEAADLAEVTRRYLAFLCRVAASHGIPRDRLYTHQGGTYPPWGTHLPFTAACNRDSTPGWSFYGLDPKDAGGLTDAFAAQGNERWAAVEWWWGAPDAQGWRDHFERTLRFGDCRFISVFNWNCGYKLKEDVGAHAALRELIRDWREPAASGASQEN